MEKYCKKQQKGFVLIGAILGMTIIGAALGGVYYLYKEKNIENNGQLAGEQIRILGQAVDEYISINRDKIANLQSDENMLCQNNGICNLTVAGLKNSGELPNTFSEYNVWKSGYLIQIKREGNPPDYKITGLVLTKEMPANKALKMLGFAVQKGGANAGTNLTDLNKISGNSGVWSYTNKDFSIISNTKYQLAYRVGYNASQYSPYLRRDGSLPMTGPLNMNKHNIQNLNILETDNAQVNNSLNVNGNTNINGHLTGNLVPRQTVTAGKNCSPNGLIAKSENGSLLSCVNGMWESPNGEKFGSYTLTECGWRSSFDERGVDYLYLFDTNSIAKHNSNFCLTENKLTGKCSCPAGTTPKAVGTSTCATKNFRGSNSDSIGTTRTYYRTEYRCLSRRR